MIRSPSYLQLSSYGIYYFRTAVPDALKPLLKRREFKCSLRTRFKHEAIGRALPLSLSIRHVFGNLSGAGVTYQEAKVLLQGYLDDQVAAVTRQLEKSGPLTFDKKWNLEQGLKQQRSFAAFDLPSHAGQKAAERILKAEGMQMDPRSKAFQDLAAWATKAVVAQIEGVLAKDAALATFAFPERRDAANDTTGRQEPFSPRTLAPSLQPAPHQAPAMPTPSAHHPGTNPSAMVSLQANAPTLTQVLTIYTAEKVREGSWTDKTKETARSKHDLLVRVLGDVPVRQVGTEQARDYKQVLQKLPANLNTKPLYRSKTISQILALKSEAGMSVTTMNNYLAWASSFFDWAERNGYADRNPLRKMLLKNPKRPDEARAAYTSEDLQKLFSTPQYSDHRFLHPHYYWLPLLGLHTGARLNELCQLYIKNVRQEDGVWVLDINEAEPDQKIKTPAARRLVPIHPKLIDLGFLRFVEGLRQDGEARLFPDLKPMRDGAGQAASKWFARYRKPLGLYNQRPKKDFHSFRTTLINTLKQKGHAEVQVAAIVGHATEGLTFGTYGKAYGPSVLVAVLSDADFNSAMTNVGAWK